MNVDDLQILSSNQLDRTQVVFQSIRVLATAVADLHKKVLQLEKDVRALGMRSMPPVDAQGRYQ